MEVPMIEILGRPHRLCNGTSRRDVLRLGALGIAGFSLADLFRLEAAQASPSPAKATNIIMVHLGGGPPHLDTYDPKPDAPSEIRGEFKSIPTKVDGIQIGELFPLQAAMMDRLALVRSIARGVDEHNSSHLITGYSSMERRQSEHPSLGSVNARLNGKKDSLIPPYVSLRGIDFESGLGAAYVGAAYEPLYSDGPGRGDLKLRVNAHRLESRRRMLDKVDGFRRDIDTRAVNAQDAFAQKALEVVSSTATYDALDVSKESADTRKRYGNDQFLVARRLVEAGVRSVALEVGGWDTHSDNFNQMRRIMPPLDKAFTSLLTDLKERGLYDQTVVIMWGEFGRTPQINSTAGRDHWSRVMSAVIAGGGLKMGQAVGATDPMGQDATEDAVRIRDVVATLYHSLGIDPAMTFVDGQSRPVPLIHDAQPIPQLIG
jgi:hypothetical protein